MTEILAGRELAQALGNNLKKKVSQLKKDGIQPFFCVINIGEDPASKIYLRTKQRKAAKLGIKSKVYQLPTATSEAEVLALIKQLNADGEVNAIMLQLPVPAQLNSQRLIAAIDPKKDVDGLTFTNTGRLWQGDAFVEPATPAGIMALFDHYQINLAGKLAVIVGRSNIVGKPLAALMLARNASVMILHSHTKNIAALTRQADVVVMAIGQAHFLTAAMVKNNAIVIDVGINRVNGHLQGDVDFEKVASKASYITPVPGGVGPLTVQLTMENVVKLTQRQYGNR